jgi:NADPH-dependent ferric siderophore reductase
MIYDRELTVYQLDEASDPLARRLAGGVSYYYGEREVYASRYYIGMQSGDKISVMAEIPLDAQITRIKTDQYVVLGDTSATSPVYRIVEAQYGEDEDGLPVTRLSLMEVEGKYDILRS